MISAQPQSAKAMRVRFVVGIKKLRIDILQEQANYVHSFTLCKLDLASLAVCRHCDSKFVLAVVQNQRLHHEIYCSPSDATVDFWLSVFDSRSVPAMKWFSSRPKCTLLPRSLMQRVREATSSEES